MNKFYVKLKNYNIVNCFVNKVIIDSNGNLCGIYPFQEEYIFYFPDGVWEYYYMVLD
jgi:hypothetical protein